MTTISKERVDIIIEELLKAKNINDAMQETLAFGSKKRHPHERIDCCIHEALAATTTCGDDDNPLVELVSELRDLALRKHYYCGDGWYSCPKAEDGCANEDEGDECNCGADAHNKKVTEIFKRIEL